MTFLTDLDEIYDSANPHMTAASVGGSTVYGEFNQPFSAESDVTGLEAQFIGKQSDLSAVEYGDTVTILSTTYEVMGISPGSEDETVELQLRESDVGVSSVATVDYTEVTSARITLEPTDKLYSLESSMALHPFTASLKVENPTSAIDYRLTNKTWDEAWLSGELSYAPAQEAVTTSGITLDHESGVDADTLDSEVVNCIADLQDKVTGLEVRVWAYPQHRHDRETMYRLRDNGIIHARNGDVSYAPVGSFLLGSDASDSVVIETWDSWCPWEATIPDGLYASDLHGKSSSEINDWLYDTAAWIAANDPTNSTELFGYDSLMEAWKDKNTWIHFYFHNTTELTVSELEDLIDILQADSDIWLDHAATIAEYAHARHAPYGATHNDPLIYEPTEDGGATPWRGKKMAATISLDDPQITGVDALIPAAIAKTCPVTVYVANLNIEENGGTTVTVAELQSFHDSGYVEIGGHSYNHYLQYENLACKVKDTDSIAVKKALSVYRDGSNMQMRFYRDSSVDFPLSLGRHLTRWWDAPNLGLADGAAITSWADRRSRDKAANASSVATYSAEYRNGLGVVNFDPTSAVPLIGGYGDIHSNTNGLMVFIAGDWQTSGYRRFFAKWSGASGGYFWHFDPASIQVAEAKTSQSGSTVNFPDYSTTWPINTWGLHCVTWTPGEPCKIFFNGTQVAEGGNAIDSIDLDDGNDTPITLGTDAAGSGDLDGNVGDIITVAWDDATIRQEMESFLMASDRWDL
uniref:Uncharacterized protein n=1 Tax=uncultured marine virus TaxID=186617 RepID=A0A0F7L4K3_9VIRU|nr:hypothetical protein [uncultured marine virus]